ncbi:MAG TPA: DNA polymerase [Arthrobacter sp.]|nr:DNA polymerase [Arthrobacter sp.]
MTIDRSKFANLNIQAEKIRSYHHGKAWKRDVTIPPEDREFIAWDGEGARDGNRQNYVLFGCSKGDYIQGEHLTTRRMLEFIISVGKAHPGAWHVGFAFEYDANMILRGLSCEHLIRLRDRGAVRYLKYRIEHIPHKWLQVTEYGPEWEFNKRDRCTVRISDVWGFFQSSFVKALRQYIPDDPLMIHIEAIEAGKEDRNNFTYERIDSIREDYWTPEIKLMERLVYKLRELLYSVDLRIKNWHGPGVLANFAYRKYKIKEHKRDCGPFVYDAARYAYAGGRFERFLIGRFTDGFGLDINSAYPYAISQLPSLAEGVWSHVRHPSSIVEFGVYHVRMRGSIVSSTAAPVFHRDSAGNISYPWVTEGWYWSPEVALLRNVPGVEIIEGWEYTDWETRPFAFVKDIYADRKRMKASGIGAQIALKLLLNSLYGKMAQRVGWERTGRAPTWHQLEWAGWVTSATRAKLYAVMARIPQDRLIAVETDGIYTTMSPAELGIEHSSELGGWEVTPFRELMYVQSGMYSKQGLDGEWSTKYRGLDAKSLDEKSIAAYLKLLTPKTAHDWPTLSGPTTRFVGYRQALWREAQGMGPMKAHHCRWEHDTKDMQAATGKRAHSPELCSACKHGGSAYETPHGTVIRSRSLRAEMSHPHDIPWLEDDRPEWRDYADGYVA